MNILDEKQIIESKKTVSNKKKRLIISIICVILAVVLSISGILIYKSSKIICTFESFNKRIALTSEKYECNNLWNAEGFQLNVINNELGILEYGTDMYLGDAAGKIVFADGNESVCFIVYDIEEQHLEGAKMLAACATAAVENYYSDFYEIITNERTYPKTDLDIPFDYWITDLYSRTQQYHGEIEQGVKISTKYIVIQYDTNKTHHYYITTRDYGDKILYDIAVDY